MDRSRDTSINGVPISSLSVDELYEIVMGRRLEWARPEPLTKVERELEADLASGKRIDVLVAHSYEGDMWRIFLEQNGFTSALAANYDQAMKAVKTLKPRLVMTHALFGMMHGPGAFELMQALRSDPETASIKVLICTMNRDAKEMLPGADAYLFAPVEMEELIDGVAKLTGKKAKKRAG